LIEDAKILSENGRYPSASYLAIVALEEEGKALMCLTNLKNGKDVAENRWKRQFKDHERKLKVVEQAISKHMREIRVDGKRLTSDELAKFIRRNKDDYFYVDWDFETRLSQITKKWKSPLRNTWFRDEETVGLIREAEIGLEAVQIDWALAMKKSV